MWLRNIPYLYCVRIRTRSILIRELFAVVGIAVGVALLFAALIASTSLNGSVTQLTNGIVGTAELQLRSRSSDGLNESIVKKVEALRGVQTAVPVLEAPVSIIGPKGSRDVQLIASSPRFARFSSPLLRRLNAESLAHEQALAVPAPIAAAIGAVSLQVVKLGVRGQIKEALIGTELTEAGVGALAHSPVAAAPLAFAQRLTGMDGRVTRVFVQVTHGSEAVVRRELTRLAGGHMNVERADSDARLFAQAAAPVNQSTLTFAAICALVGFVFAFNAMLLTVELRRGLVEELRGLGATRLQMVEMLLFDALMLGMVASILGLVLGDLLSLLAFHNGPGYLAFAFPVGSPRLVNWQDAGIGVGAAMLAASVGVLTPLREIWSRAHYDPRVRRRRLGAHLMLASIVVGLACLGGTTAILLAAPQSAVLGIVLLVIALILLLPLLADAATAGFARMARHASAPSAEITVAELRARQTRTRAMALAATGAIAVFAVVTIQGSHVNLQGGLTRLVDGLSRGGDVWVLAPGEQNTLATTPLAEDLAPRLANISGVMRVGRYRSSFLEYDSRRVWVLALPSTAAGPIPANQLLSGRKREVDNRLRSGGWAVLSATLAAAMHLHIGERFTLPSAHPLTLRLAGTSTNLGWPPGAVVMNGRNYVQGWGQGSTSAYALSLDPHVSPRVVAARVRRAVAPGHALAVETREERTATQITVSDKGLKRLTEIAILVLIGGILAIVVTMSASIAQRRERFAAMKPEGITAGVLWASLIFESALLVGGGCLTGAIFGIYGETLLSHALTTVTGFPVLFSAQPWLALVSFVLVTGAAAIIIAVPGYWAATTRPESHL